MALLLLLALFVAAILYISWQRTKYWERRGVPGPTPSLFVGNLWQLGKSNIKSWPISYREWTQQYGSWVGIQRGWRNLLIISDQQMAHEVMHEKFEYFHERDLAPIAGDVDKDPLQHVFTSRGKRWKRLRALTSPAFSVNSLKKILPTIDYCAGETTRLIEKHADDGKMFDMHTYFYEYTMDVICKVGLGIPDCRQFENKFIQLVQSVLDDIDGGLNNASWILPFLGPYLRIAQLGSAIIGQWEFVSMMKMLKKNIADRKEIRAQGISEEKSADFIDLFLDAEIEELVEGSSDGVYDKTKDSQIVKKLSNDELLAQCFLFLFAGFDTTAATLAFTSYYLVKCPEVQEKMRQEIDEFCVKPNPTYEDLNKLKYTDAVMKETLRLHPIAAMASGRKCVANTKIGSLQIEKGTDVILDVISLHLDKQVWGKDADEFKPERWFSSDLPQQSFYSFGAGPRVCAGMRMAVMEQKMLLVHLLRKYRLVLTEKTELKVAGFILHPKEVMVRLENLK